jgi:LysM repeat protein
LAEAPVAELVSLKFYTAKRGDTLSVIARKVGVSKADLAGANSLKATARVEAGDQLVVPQEATALMAARSDRAAPATQARTTVAPSGQLAQAATSSNRVKESYQVRQGDTLSSIARFYQTTVAAIKTWNPRIPTDRLDAGQKLTVYRLAN